jgi:hypothetical protein
MKPHTSIIRNEFKTNEENRDEITMLHLVDRFNLDPYEGMNIL